VGNFSLAEFEVKLLPQTWEQPHRSPQDDFAHYAAKYWASHLREAESYVHPELLKQVLNLCNTASQRFMTWFEVYWLQCFLKTF
jgi:hypothetical protein